MSDGTSDEYDRRPRDFLKEIKDDLARKQEYILKLEDMLDYCCYCLQPSLINKNEQLSLFWKFNKSKYIEKQIALKLQQDKENLQKSGLSKLTDLEKKALGL